MCLCLTRFALVGYSVPMRGTENGSSVDWKAAETLDRLMTDRGWTPRDVQYASRKTGHPHRRASYRVIYRVLSEGHKPSRPVQFEIAAAFGLLPSHIWGDVPIPDSYSERLGVAA